VLRAPQKVYKTVLFPSPTLTPAAAADASDSAAASSSASAALPPPVPVLLKHRFPKRYRHPHLDAQLTRLRVTSEARSLVRAARGGVSVPALRGVDVEAGIVGMEWIEGWSVREVLGGGAESDEAGGSDDEDGSGDAAASAEEETPAPEPWAGLDLGASALVSARL
jgi:TP53 regulating kinase-like protein